MKTSGGTSLSIISVMVSFVLSIPITFRKKLTPLL